MNPMIWVLILVAGISFAALFILRSPNRQTEAPDGAESDDQENSEREKMEDDPAEAFDQTETDEADSEEEGECLEEIPLTSETAKLAGLRVEQRPPGLYADPRDQLRFMADFKVFKGKKKSYSRSLEIPEELYDRLKIGESATLITQGNLFFDFGDRYAESVEE